MPNRHCFSQCIDDGYVTPHALQHCTHARCSTRTLLLADASREDRAKLGAWAALLRLLALYAMGSPDVVDAELASDLVVITASAFEGAEAQAHGEPAAGSHRYDCSSAATYTWHHEVQRALRRFYIA